MARFLVEVPHSEDPGECARAVQFFLETGSHFMTHADWGCADGVHKAYIILDAESRDEARSLVPRVFRSDATIVKLNKFAMEDIEEVLEREKVLPQAGS